MSMSPVFAEVSADGFTTCCHPLIKDTPGFLEIRFLGLGSDALSSETEGPGFDSMSPPVRI